MATIETPEARPAAAGRPGRPQERAGQPRPRQHHQRALPEPAQVRTLSPSRRPTWPWATPPPSRPPSRPPRPTSAASQQLQSFERIYAPFDGVVTARNTDIGDLITGGSGGAQPPSELFRLAAIDRCASSSPSLRSTPRHHRDGDTATLTLDEYPGQTFTGTIARNSSAIDPASRTLNVEVDVPNPTGKLLPGAYAFVHFKVPAAAAQLTVPSNTLLFRAQGTAGRRRPQRPRAAPARHDRAGPRQPRSRSPPA